MPAERSVAWTRKSCAVLWPEQRASLFSDDVLRGGAFLGGGVCAL